MKQIAFRKNLTNRRASTPAARFLEVTHTSTRGAQRRQTVSNHHALKLITRQTEDQRLSGGSRNEESDWSLNHTRANRTPRVTVTGLESTRPWYISKGVLNYPTRRGHDPADLRDVRMRGGIPIHQPLRTFFEESYNYDFDRVRLHTDTSAKKLTDILNVKAITIGNHIFFGSKIFSLNNGWGKRILAHELVHVVQQAEASDTLANRPILGYPGDKYEAEAEQVGSIISRGEPLEHSASQTRIICGDGGVPQIQALGLIGIGIIVSALGAAIALGVFAETEFRGEVTVPPFRGEAGAIALSEGDGTSDGSPHNSHLLIIHLDDRILYGDLYIGLRIWSRYENNTLRYGAERADPESESRYDDADITFQENVRYEHMRGFRGRVPIVSLDIRCRVHPAGITGDIDETCTVTISPEEIQLPWGSEWWETEWHTPEEYTPEEYTPAE